jgi:hypothetical protein
MSECAARNGGFLAYPRQCSGRTQPALRETNGPQKPGRAIAPKGHYSPIASAASDLDLPLQSGLSLARDVFGRRSGSQSTIQMQSHDTTTGASEPPANRSYTPYTSGGDTEVYAKTAGRRGDKRARTLRTLRFQTRVYYTHGESLCGHILSSWVEVYGVYESALSDLPPRRPRKISYTSKNRAKCTYTSPSGGVVNA